MLSISIGDWDRLFHNFTAEEGVLLIRERTIIDDENNAYITTYNNLVWCVLRYTQPQDGRP